jgi:anti-anti-sigma factor
MSKLEIVKPPFRRLDAAAAQPLRVLMQGAWLRQRDVVALDLTDVAYIDSLGLSTLVAEFRQKPPRGKIVLFGLTEYVREVFEITKMSLMFEIFESAPAVVAAHAGGHASPPL